MSYQKSRKSKVFTCFFYPNFFSVREEHISNHISNLNNGFNEYLYMIFDENSKLSLQISHFIKNESI